MTLIPQTRQSRLLTDLKHRSSGHANADRTAAHPLLSLLQTHLTSNGQLATQRTSF